MRISRPSSFGEPVASEGGAQEKVSLCSCFFVYDKLFEVSSTDRGAASAVNEPPSRKPDAVLEEQTSTSQAALYRYVYITVYLLTRTQGNFDSLNGDWNPLHVWHTSQVFKTK